MYNFEEMNDECGTIKITITGDCGTGKTQLLNQYSQNVFSHNSKSTIGVNFFTKFFPHETSLGKGYRLHLWDTAGQEKYKAFTNAYYRHSAGIIICYDITSRKSFNNIDMWINQIRENVDIENIKIIIVGTHYDCTNDRKISFDEGFHMAKKHSAMFFETSASTGHNVENMFNHFIRSIINDKQQNDLITSKNACKIVSNVQKTNTKLCC